MHSGLPIPALLLVLVPSAALLVGFFGLRPFPRLTHWPMLASCLAVTGCSLWLLTRVYAGASWDETVYRWALAGPFSVEFGLRIDGLSVSVLSMVSVVGTLIHVYAVGYMARDPGFWRFFLYFHFFFLSMVGLLVSNNYLQLYVFWEGVGLASYLLIGFWYREPAPRAAAWKAFLVNRVGDVGFLLAVFILLRALGTVRFEDVFPRAADLGPGLVTAVPLLLVWGACAKSAQFPLHVWLPDAMEGPTPVSALMHAATMVTAGVFLLARSMPLLRQSPAALTVVAAVGMLTALGSAFVASVKKDIKRVLAYSTISHLGIMMIGIGTANVFGAVFHLIVHGFFKGLLFLCAGDVIHGLHGRLGGRRSADVDDCGGLARSLPLTFACFLAGSWALSGIPPLSGFWSKEQVLGGAMEAGLSRAFSALAVLVSLASSFYIFRILFLTFLGDRPGPADSGSPGRPAQRGPEAAGDVHEPGAVMTVPVALLALSCLGAGALGAPLARLLGLPEPGLPVAPTALGAGAAAVGLLLAWAETSLAPRFDWDWRRRWPGFERLSQDELGWQSAMNGAGRAARGVARAVGDFWERRTWDVFTESLADVCIGVGEWLSSFSRGLLNQYLWWMLAGVFAFACTGLLWR